MKDIIKNITIINDIKKKLYGILLKIRPCEITILIKCFLGIKREIIQIGTLLFKIDPVSNLGYSLIKNYEYEPKLSNLLANILGQNDVFIDLGSNEGYFSILASNLVGNGGKVISVEPQTVLIPVLKENIKLNNASNIELVSVAVGNNPGTAMLTGSFNTNTGTASLIHSKRFGLLKKHYVKIITLDSLLDKYNLQSVKMLKIDIEGYEYFALLSATQSLKMKKFKYIYVDIHKHQLKLLKIDPIEIKKLMESYGYKLISISGLNIYSS